MILVAGNGQLPIAIERRLQRMGAEAERLRPVDAGEHLSPEEFRRASALVLAAEDDSGNVDLALQARKACPELPLIVRIFDSTLAAYLSETISGVTILSMSKIATPVFAEAALRVLAEPHADRPVGADSARALRRGYRVDRILVTALLSDWVLSRRLDVLNGRIRVRNRNHVVIAGAGNLGLRIAGLLAADGKRLVIIENKAENHNVAALRDAGHHVIIADATYRDTLALAGVDKAALVLAVTDIDAVNLQIALHAREMNVPVIMRVESSELSAHVTARGDGIALSPIVAAAEAFALASTIAR